MDLLVDTHVLAWIANDDERLSKRFVDTLPDPDTRLFVSAVTAYEYSDLLARNRFPAKVDIPLLQAELGFDLLDYPADLWPVTVGLPDIHRDPVDRMLVAHAIALDLTLVTADRNMRRYSVKSLW